MGARRTSKRTRGQPEQAASQILEAFSARAKRVGIRAVMMGELAAELRMSASTLYKQFPSKEALVLACVDRWADELAAAEAALRAPGAAPRDAFEQFMHWVDAWADANAAISPVFIRDLQSDYPTAWRRFRDIVRQRQEQGAALLRPVLKPKLDERVAFAVLKTILYSALQPEFADPLGISRREALRSAVSIWAGGAVDRRGQLRALRGGRTARKDST
jgi:AcrR family transcriptional regulator